LTLPSRTLLKAAAAFVLTLILGACGAAEQQPLRFGQAPWGNGETTTYRVTDINGEYAGTATFAVTAGAANDPAGWTLQRNLNVQGDQEIAALEMSGAGFRPQSSTVVRIRPDGTEQVKTAYRNGQADMELMTKAGVVTVEQRSVPSDARDLLSLPLIARSLPLTKGYSARINAFFPITGRLERVAITIEDQESISTLAGVFDAWRIKLEIPDSESFLWVGVEPPHPLVKFKDGRSGALYELESFTSGS
jgi:hypothetical protein